MDVIVVRFSSVINVHMLNKKDSIIYTSYLLLVYIQYFFLIFYIASDSNFTHIKIPSIVIRLMCFPFPIYYERSIAY
ncbi:hypothetical protein COJ86_22925 [Bacillus cereus]|nr:hypothetical protein COJ86_22925 [Bacillus cereus]